MAKRFPMVTINSPKTLGFSNASTTIVQRLLTRRFPVFVLAEKCGFGEVFMDSDSNQVADCGAEYPQDPAKTLAGI
jgi:hypothetical protein